MATRATVRRRRRFLTFSTIVAVTLTTLFIRDVVQAAHESTTNRSSLNRSFSVLVNASLIEQDKVDAATMILLSHARSMSRNEFKTTLIDLSQRMDRVEENARLLDTPAIARRVNRRFMEVTLSRVMAWRTIRDALEAPLRLVDRSAPTPTEIRRAFELIQTSNRRWSTLRLALRHEPGHRVMRASRWSLSSVSSRDISKVTQLSNLTPFSAIAIGAIAIDPQPLPSRSAQVVLLPKTEVGIGVTVRNVGRSTVSVVVSVSTKWRRGDPATMSIRRTIAAGTSTAVIFPAVPTYPGVRGSLTVHVGGAAPAWRGAATREYSLKVAPSD